MAPKPKAKVAAKGAPKPAAKPAAKPAPKPFQPRMRDPVSGAPMRAGKPVAAANGAAPVSPFRKLPLRGGQVLDTSGVPAQPMQKGRPRELPSNNPALSSDMDAVVRATGMGLGNLAKGLPPGGKGK